MYKIIKVLNEHKKVSTSKPVRKSHKRVMASVEENGRVSTRHVEVHIDWLNKFSNKQTV